MLEKVTVPKKIEIDPNTGVVSILLAKCVVDTETKELVGEPGLHRVGVTPGETLDEVMAGVNESLVRDLKCAPVAPVHMKVAKDIVDLVHTPAMVNRWKEIKATPPIGAINKSPKV